MDAAAFEAMYRAHYPALRQAAYMMIRDKDAAHDLVQEVFVRLWDKLGDLDGIVNQKAYLLRAVMNASITFLGKNKRHVELSREADSKTASSESLMMARELESRIQAALDRLPPKCKAIFMLSRFEEKSYKQIAAILGLSIKTVENQMGIALKKLREDLKPYIPKDLLLCGLAGGLAWLAFISGSGAFESLM